MLSLRITNATHLCRSPAGMEINVRPLMIRREGDVSVSHWEPTPSELAMLFNGGCVELRIVGPMVPVALGVHRGERLPALEPHALDPHPAG